MRTLPPLVIVPLALLIALSRLWLGHHTVPQVLAGCSYGILFSFLPGEEDIDLYAVLGITAESTSDDIKKAYRKKALTCHPDKHSAASEEAQAEMSTKFQQVGFAYAVLSDDKRRKRYDSTGQTDEGSALDPGDGGWEAYFEDLYERVTRGKLDEMKKEYQGSAEEIADLKAAYTETDGSIGDIMTHIPHSTSDDEARFVMIISGLIKSKELPKLATWESSIKDEKAKLARRKQSDQEAREAEELAKELGVWEEFYGSGKAGERKAKGKGKAKAGAPQEEEEEEDHSVLQAMILKKRKNMDSFFDGLASKYSEPQRPAKGKKGKRNRQDDDDDDGADDKSPRKKSKGARAPSPPDIDDAEFERLQKELFGKKKGSTDASTSKPKRTSGRKAK
ncbi:DnaJ-domain-containing protein [Hymenopellis radicata]|nr:DnaJ-domain-containing protein [Hymenopellis radicata]